MNHSELAHKWAHAGPDASRRCGSMSFQGDTLAMVQRQLGRGWSAKSDGLVRRTIGDYPLDRIDADGTLHAGCHSIPFSELALMARTLGLEVQS